MTRKIGFYHKNCNDGYAAAWVLQQKFERAIKLVPFNYHDTLEGVMEDDELIFVDCSIPPDIALQYLEAGANITIIDHHKTAMEAWADSDLRKKYAERLVLEFDMAKSGATLAWAYYFGKDVTPPDVLKYIEDRDLWTKALPGCDDYYAGLASLNWYTPEGQLDFAPLHLMTNEVINLGRTVNQLAEQATNKALTRIHGVVINDALYPCVNVDGNVSDIAQAVMEKTSKLVACCYYVGNEVVHFSLRSRADYDVSIDAQAYKGGGHQNAAGFTLPYTEALQLLGTMREWIY